LDLDAVRDDEWVGRGMDVLEGMVIIEGKEAFVEVIVTDGNFAASLCESDALFPNDFGEGLVVE